MPVVTPYTHSSKRAEIESTNEPSTNTPNNTKSNGVSTPEVSTIKSTTPVLAPTKDKIIGWYICERS